MITNYIYYAFNLFAFHIHALSIRGLAAMPLRLRRARLERVGHATAAGLSEDKSYYFTNMFYK